MAGRWCACSTAGSPPVRCALAVLLRAGMALLLAAAASACTPQRPAPASTRPVITVAVASPLSGDRAALGVAIRNGVQLAVEKHAAPMAALGFDLRLAAFDDRARADVGRANAARIVADPEVLLVVGHLTSSVALPASEVYATAGVAMVSPANSDPQLTERGLETVFRVVGRDDVQGRAAAEFAASDLKARRVVIARDGSALGRAAAAAFRQAALRLGIAVGGEVEVAGDVAPLVEALGTSPPDLIFLAMPFAQAGAVIREVRRREVPSAFIGPDWLDSPRLLQAAGRSAVGTYFTLVAGPPDFYPGAEEFVRDYRRRFVAEPAAFALQAYDAAALGLDAIARAARAAGGRPSRRQVAGAIRDTAFRGLSGAFRLNPRGDPDPASYFVVRVTSANPGEWERRTLMRTLRLPPPAAPR